MIFFLAALRTLSHTEKMKILESLSNHFLIAMPSLEDAFFSRSVIYLYEHSPAGSMGIVINKSIKITFERLLQHLDIEMRDSNASRIPVFAGGPITPEQGFVLHNRLETEKEKRDSMGVSSSQAMLKQIANGKGPDNFFVALGHSSWGKGQLESEINRNDWLVSPLNPNIIFSTPPEKRWQAAAHELGVDLTHLSQQTGHA